MMGEQAGEANGASVKKSFAASLVFGRPVEPAPGSEEVDLGQLLAPTCGNSQSL